MISFGGGSSKSVTNPGSVWKPQQPFLTSLYQNAQNLYGQQAPGIGQAAGGLAQGLAGGTSNYMTWNPYISQQIQGFGADLGNFFQNQILPGIASSAGVAGQFGGSRQGVAAGMAGQDLGRQFAQGATNIRSDAYNSTMQNLPQLYNLGMSQYSAPWMPLGNMAAALGGPAILGGGGQSRANEFNFGLG